FQGNTTPARRRAHLEEMIRLVSEGADIVCLQELPVWSLASLSRWSAKAVAAERTVRPWLPGGTAKLVTDIHHGLFRSAFTGHANAMLVSRAYLISDHEYTALNDRRGRKRRMCGVVRLRVGESTALVANLHSSGSDRELTKALEFVESLAGVDEPIMVAG